MIKVWCEWGIAYIQVELFKVGNTGKTLVI